MPVKTKPDTFYAIDFDRCLGDVDASFDLLLRSIESLKPGASVMLTELRAEVEATGGSFSPYDHIIGIDGISWLELESAYLDLANKTSIVMDGAVELIDYLANTGRYFCIMSYGNRHWQQLKVKAAGFSNWPLMIVDTPQKAEVIARWHGGDEYLVPGDGFVDGVARIFTEVVLIDDKAVSFNGRMKGTRGYWVNGRGAKPGTLSDSILPDNVVTVESLHEIIATETGLV